MADDAPTTPPEQQLVQWLRALADVVESDPAFATRVTQGMTSPPALEAIPGDIAASDEMVAETPPVQGNEAVAPQAVTLPQASESIQATAPQSNAAAQQDERADDQVAVPATIAPTLRHTRKTSRFGPSVAGRPAELGTGIPDPFALFARDGEEGLRRALGALRIGSLRAIIRTHDLDPSGKVGSNATEKRLITVIVGAVKRAEGTPKPTPAKPSRGRSRSTPPMID